MRGSKTGKFVAIGLALAFLGAMWWAKGRDPFRRIDFTVRTTEHGNVRATAALPKTATQPLPVVVYLHGAGGNLLGSGNELRQMAELGLAIVGLEYNQTNDTAFTAQFSALLQHLQRQKWADPDATAWVGYSLGAEKATRFALNHPAQSPKLLVRLAGGWLPEFDRLEPPAAAAPATAPNRLIRSHVLLVHGERDELFPASDVSRIADALRSAGATVEVRMLPEQPHRLEPHRGLVFRLIGEDSLTRLKGPQAWTAYHSIAQWQAEALPLWVCWLPAAAWAIAGVYWQRRGTSQCIAQGNISSAEAQATAAVPPKHAGWKRGWRWLAGIFLVLALGRTALQLVPPQMAVNETTLAIARKHLLQPHEREDFDFLAANPAWHGQRLKTLLAHVQLAGYNRQLVSWKLDDALYREFVLSPVIDPASNHVLNWRRPLWESGYPRVRRAHNLDSAADTIIHHLRERVTVADGGSLSVEIESIWRRQLTTTQGFERLCVAALRSVGVPARLNSAGKAEFHDGTNWRDAPQPLPE
ncbi:MAG: dienelactone hydrolase family protein [Verrucomicrobia bacterium]|nr:dienelactone hydrolase family protein [Verrucomicrobiota bacterium]